MCKLSPKNWTRCYDRNLAARCEWKGSRMKRKQYSASFKAKVAAEAIRGIARGDHDSTLIAPRSPREGAVPGQGVGGLTAGPFLLPADH